MHNTDPLNENLRRIGPADLPWSPMTPIATVAPLPISNGKPPNDSPAASSDCDCGGIGWYSAGPSKPLIRCSCGRVCDQARQRRRLGDELGDLAHCTFSTFSLTRPLAPIYQLDSRYYRDLARVPLDRRAAAAVISVAVQETCLLNAYDDARAYAANPIGWLCFHGAYGAGKSHLAAAIAHLRVSAGWSVRYRSVPGMLDAIKEGFKDGSSDMVFHDVLGADLLILDDLGAQHLTGWGYERLFRIINERQHRPTIITTNVHPDDLGDARDVDAQRLADRIAGAARSIWMPISSYRRLSQEAAS